LVEIIASAAWNQCFGQPPQLHGVFFRIPFADENPVQDAGDVGVKDWSVLVEGKRPDGARCVAAYPLERQQLVMIAG
jgi:hypothetical protein